MTIITVNHNPKNDSKYARHRSVWKDQTNILENVLTNLKAAQGVKYKHYRGTPADVREMWDADFGAALPFFRVHKFTGTSGVDTWLGARRQFTDDVKVIWADFVGIFKKRSDNATGTTKELLFVSHTQQHFDLIYSKWGVAPGKHWFFHWTSMVAPQPANRAAIDVGNDDEAGESTESD